MRQAGFGILVGLLGFVHAMAGQSHGAFAGAWAMDPTRSESAHQNVPVTSQTVVIGLTGAELTMETTRIDSGESAPFHEVLRFKLDGSESTSIQGGQTITGKAHWDGPKLVVETARS